MSRRRAVRRLAGEVEAESLSQALDVAPVEELDPNVRVALAKFPQLAVLSCHERLLHHRHLNVEVLLREIEVGREGLRDTAVLALRQRERPRLVLPRNAVKVQQAGAFALCVVREARSSHASGWLGPRPTERSSAAGCRRRRLRCRPEAGAALPPRPSKPGSSGRRPWIDRRGLRSL